MNILLLMMAGSGVRFGADIPKQFVLVDGKPVFSYILKGYNSCAAVDHIVMVTHPEWIGYVQEWKERLGAGKVRDIVPGGATRSESVRNGLRAAASFAGEEDVVMIHDATHPYVDEEGTAKIVEAVKKFGGATLGQRQYDTVYQMDADTHMLKRVVPREEIVSGASPEAFRFGELFRIYQNSSDEELASMTSAGAMALHYGIPMKVVEANVINLKITYKNDMEVFRHLVHQYFPKNRNIAIDGPAGAGKSTIAKRVAEEKGLIYVDTGAMYRAMGIYFSRLGIDPADAAAIADKVDGADISIEYSDGAQQVILNGENVTDLLRTEAAGNMASKVSSHGPVRTKMVELQQKLGREKAVVMDGRDIGTVVLPDAGLKIYLTASVEVRAMRRYKELTEKGQECDLAEIEKDIAARDHADMTREISPLRQAEDAVLVDTSEMTISEVVSAIETLYEARI